MDNQEKYDVPTELPVILRDWIREVLRYNPENIVDFSHTYFSALANTGRVTSSSLHNFSTGSTHIGVYSVPEKLSYATFQSGVDPQYESIRSERAEAYTVREDNRSKDVFCSTEPEQQSFIEKNERDESVKEDVVQTNAFSEDKMLVGGNSLETSSEQSESSNEAEREKKERLELRKRQIQHYTFTSEQYRGYFEWPGRQEVASALVAGKAMLLHRVLGGKLVDPETRTNDTQLVEEHSVHRDTVATILRTIANTTHPKISADESDNNSEETEEYSAVLASIEKWRVQADARLPMDDVVGIISMFTGSMAIPEFLHKIENVLPKLPGLSKNNLRVLDTIDTVSVASQRKYTDIYQSIDDDNDSNTDNSSNHRMPVADIQVVNDEVLDVLARLPVSSTADEDLRSALLGKSFDTTLSNAQSVLQKLRELAFGMDTVDDAYDAAMNVVHADVDEGEEQNQHIHNDSISQSSQSSTSSKLLRRVDRVISQRQQDLQQVLADTQQLESGSLHIAAGVLLSNLSSTSVTDMLVKEVAASRTNQPLEPEAFISKDASIDFTAQDLLQQALQQTDELTNPEFTFVVNTVIPKRQAYMQVSLAPKVQILTNTFLDLDVELNGTLSVELVQTLGSILQNFKNTQKRHQDYYNEQVLYIDQCESDEQVSATDFTMYLLHKANALDNETFKQAIAYATDSILK